jgi:hypothetical protein
MRRSRNQRREGVKKGKLQGDGMKDVKRGILGEMRGNEK